MVFVIKDKVALITGAASGIGLQYVKELLRNGAKGVLIADINKPVGDEAVKKINAEFGANKAHFLATDVTDATQLENAFKAAIKIWNGIDIIIPNAGIMNDKKWELQSQINCDHVVRVNKLAIKYIGKNNGGKGGIVVNIASILGLQKLAGCPIYTATKHFVIGLTRSFGTTYYYDRTGIEFKAMCPGVTDTPLISEAEHFSLEGVEGVGKLLADELGSLPKQPAECVAKGLIVIITKGDNGSVWVAEGQQPIYEVEIPDRLTLKV